MSKLPEKDTAPYVYANNPKLWPKGARWTVIDKRDLPS